MIRWLSPSGRWTLQRNSITLESKFIQEARDAFTSQISYLANTFCLAHFVPRSKTWRRFWAEYFASMYSSEAYSVPSTPALSEASLYSSASTSPLNSPESTSAALAPDDAIYDNLGRLALLACNSGVHADIISPTPAWSHAAFQNPSLNAPLDKASERDKDPTFTLIEHWRDSCK
jgi:hypothetical protein